MATQAQEKISEVIPKLIKVDIVCNKKVLFPVEVSPFFLPLISNC